MTFFYRYSTPSRSNSRARTHLRVNSTILSEGGEADLSPVHVDPIIKLFQLCYQRLMDRLSSYNTKRTSQSLLASLIDTVQIRRERFSIMEKSKSYRIGKTTIPHNHPGKVTPNARVGHTFFKSSPPKEIETSQSDNANKTSSSSAKKPESPINNETQDKATKKSAKKEKQAEKKAKKAAKKAKQKAKKAAKEATKRTREANNGSQEDESVHVARKSPKTKGKRNPRGALIPKYRPDVEMRATGEEALLQRGGKNRKNKKKQKRDSAITEFCRKG